MTSPMQRSSEKLSISCYDDVSFNFYYFITVPIGKTCSKSLMRFNSHIFYTLFYFIPDLKQLSTMFFNLCHCYDRLVLSEGHKKLLQGLVSHELAAYLSTFNLFKLNELWPYY